MKKKRIGLLVLDGLAGLPGVPAVFVRTRMLYPPDFVESEPYITTTVCRGVPFIRKPCEARIRISPVDSDAEWRS